MECVVMILAVTAYVVGGHIIRAYAVGEHIVRAYAVMDYLGTAYVVRRLPAVQIKD